MTKSVTTIIGIKRYNSSIMKAKFDIDVFISYCTFSFNKKMSYVWYVFREISEVWKQKLGQ